MKLSDLLNDEQAVSPVIGVILMVAITVILAAVIGAFVLGIGGGQEQVPSASFEWSNTSAAGSAPGSPSYNCGSTTSENYVAAVHQGGDELNTANLALNGEDCASAGSGDSLAAGSSVFVRDVSDGTSVSLVWKSPSSDSSSILSSYVVG